MITLTYERDRDTPISGNVADPVRVEMQLDQEAWHPLARAFKQFLEGVGYVFEPDKTFGLVDDDE